VLLAVVALAMEAILGALAKDRRVRGAKLLLAASVVVTLVSAWPALATRKTNIDRIAAALQKATAREDLIVMNPWYHGVAFDRYYQGAAPYILVPPLSDATIHRYDLLKEALTRSDPLEPVFARMAETMQAGHRVWIAGGLGATPAGEQAKKLPPASDATGWSYERYLFSWNRELGDFLRAHAQRGDRVAVDSPNSVSPYEYLALFSFEGWKP
jgi:hypothetical protein